MDLFIGAMVESADGLDVGTVERIIIELATNEVTHYVVHSTVGGRRDVVVPVAVADERERILRLGISRSEFELLPDYLQARYGIPSESFTAGIGGESRAEHERATAPKPHVPEDGVVEVGKGEPVDCVDGEVGAIEGVDVDELTDEVTDLLVDVKRRRKIAAVPTAWASRLGPTRIQLQCRISEVESLVR